jgi:hypothetical protein
MFGTILSIVSGVSDAINIYKFVSRVAKGDDVERVLGELERLHAQVKRLSDNILYAPRIEGLSSTAGLTHRVNSLREARTLLEPVQEALGGKIVSSGLIETPDKMQKAMAANPRAVLDAISPQHLAVRHPNPDMVPVLFMHQGERYIGWQMREALPLLFNCELHDLPGLSASRVPLPPPDPPPGPIPSGRRYIGDLIARSGFTDRDGRGIPNLTEEACWEHLATLYERGLQPHSSARLEKHVAMRYYRFYCNNVYMCDPA